jgi:uncharacterized membrane protein YidH (DUF202 family)
VTVTDPGWRRAFERTERAGRGLANERTALAWSRSALSLAAIGGLILHFGSEKHAYVVAYPLGAGVLVMAAAAWGYGNSVYAGRRREATDHVARPTALRIMAIVNTLLAIAAFVIALFS